MVKNIAIKLMVIFIIISPFELVGCASNAGIDEMIYSGKVLTKLHTKSLENNIVIADVSGGRETGLFNPSQINNDNFKAALALSLKRANLYHMINGERYQLTANLLSLKQPWVGFDLKVDCEIHYDLLDKKINKIIYAKTISSSYTASFGESPIAVTRLRKANEGAARNNIKKLIEDLYQL